MRRNEFSAVTVLLALGLAGTAGGVEEVRRAWDFEAEPPGPAEGLLESRVGRWEVVTVGGNKVVAQQAANSGRTYNVALIRDERARYGDVDLSVRIRPIAGEEDRGGGLVWRAVDDRNYYVARYNPLEDNLRVYTVVDGLRTQLQSVDLAARPAGWFTLRVVMRGDRIAVSLDGAELLNLGDDTFPRPGRIGLWTKADAQSAFDDLRAGPPEAPGR